MLRSSLLCLLPLVICVAGQRGNNGIEYYGTSNVRYQKSYPPPLPLRERLRSIPISTKTVSPPPTRPATEVPKTNQLNATTLSGPSYIPRRRPFLLPRPTRPGSGPKQQATEPPLLIAPQATLYVDTQLPEITAPEPSIISASQPSIVTAPQVVIQLISGPQTPLNTSFQTSAVEMSIPPAVVSPTLTPVPTLQHPTVAVSLPNASPVSVQPEKELVSFVSKPGPISQIQAKPILQTKLELNPLGNGAREEVPQPEADSMLQSTSSIPTSGQVSYPIKLRPQITFVPVLDPVSVKETHTTIPQSLNVSNIKQEPTFEITLTTAPVVATPQMPSIAANPSSVNASTQPPIITAPQIPTVTEIQSLATAPKLPFSETKTQVITAPQVIIRSPQLPLNLASQLPSPATRIFPADVIHEPAVTSVQLNGTADPQPSALFYSTLDTPRISKVPVQPKTKPASYVPEAKNIVELDPISQLEPDLTTQSEPETTAQPKTETAFQLKTNLPAPDQFSYPIKLKPQLTVAESSSPLSEVPQRPDQPKQFLVPKVSDSESALVTTPESKGAAEPDSELASHLDSETAFEPEPEISSKPYSYPIKLRPQVSFVAVPDPAWKPVAVKPKSPVLPPLLPRPNPIREPAYVRYNQPTTEYPNPTSTHYMTTVPPVITTTQAPHLSNPNTIRQPNYGRYIPPTTEYPIIATTQITTKALPINTFTSERPGSSKLDFVCKGNGYYAVDNECNTYILCQQNNATKFSCPDGLYFNPATKYYEYPCVNPSVVQCIGGTEKQYPRPTRQCPKQYGLFSMNDGDCSKYIMCNIGVATIMNCPAGLVFNPTTESCDWVVNVPQCNPQVFKDYTCPDPPVDEYGVASDIIYKYKYENQCHLYIACQRGYPRLLSCGRGLAFDEASQSCISSVYVRNCASYAA